MRVGFEKATRSLKSCGFPRSVRLRRGPGAAFRVGSKSGRTELHASVLLLLASIYAGRGPGGLVCSNRCIRNVSAGTHNMQAVDDTSEAVDVDGGLRATADEEKKYRP